jgi:hypothetical protein
MVDHLADDMVGQGQNGSLRYCITNATDGDSIAFGDGITGTINLTGALPDLRHSVRIEGPGADLMTVRRDTGGDYRIFTVTTGATVSISGVTIANGHLFILGDEGAGILNRGTLTLSSSTVADNRTDGAEFANGGGIFNSGTMTIVSSLVTNNIAAVFGGGGNGIANSGNLTIVESAFSRNDGAGPGAIYNNGGMVAVSNSTIVDNTANEGGGIFNARGTVTVSNSTLSGNTGGFEGGAIANMGTMGINDSTLSGNAAEGGGGGISNGGTLTIANSTISGNSNTVSFRGGGITSHGALNMRNTILARNMDSGGAPDLDGNLASSGYNLIGNTQGVAASTPPTCSTSIPCSARCKTMAARLRPWP